MSGLTSRCGALGESLEHDGTQLRDVAGAEGEDQVTGPRVGSDYGSGIIKVGEVLNSFATLLYSPGERFRRDTFDRRLTCCVYIKDVKRVCVIKRAGKLIHKVAGASIAVRLENNVNFVEVTLLRCSQRRANLCRMVTVIIDHTD